MHIILPTVCNSLLLSFKVYLHCMPEGRVKHMSTPRADEPTNIQTVPGHYTDFKEKGDFHAHRNRIHHVFVILSWVYANCRVTKSKISKVEITWQPCIAKFVHPYNGNLCLCKANSMRHIRKSVWCSFSRRHNPEAQPRGGPL
jgi:hypothetical protein